MFPFNVMNLCALVTLYSVTIIAIVFIDIYKIYMCIYMCAYKDLRNKTSTAQGKSQGLGLTNETP